MKGWVLLCVFFSSAVLGLISFNEFSSDLKLDEEKSAMTALTSISHSSDLASICLTEYEAALGNGNDEQSETVTYADMVAINMKVVRRCANYEPNSDDRLSDTKRRLFASAGENGLQGGDLKAVFNGAQSCLEFAVAVESVCPELFSARRVTTDY